MMARGVSNLWVRQQQCELNQNSRKKLLQITTGMTHTYMSASSSLKCYAAELSVETCIHLVVFDKVLYSTHMFNAK